MSNKFLDLYKSNKSLSTNDKKELVSLFSSDLCFDEVFAKTSVAPSDIASILENYGSFWVTIDADESNKRLPHAVVVSDITRDSTENCTIKYYDVADGEIKETNFTDFIFRVQNGNPSTDSLKTAAIRLVRSVGEGGTPKINLKCAIPDNKIKVNCVVDIYIKVTDDNSFFDSSYDVKLASPDNSLSITKTDFTIESDWTFIATLSRASEGSASLRVTVNDSSTSISTDLPLEFVDEKSAFTRIQRDDIITLNKSLINNDSVCFRVADKAISGLLNDPGLILSSYANLTGFTRMKDYEDKGYVFHEQKFNQSIIWKRKSENGYDFKPFAFRTGQENCFSKFVQDTMLCLGVHVYHYILLNGYHVLILLVDNTNSCYPKFKILDQLKERDWQDLSKLDGELLTMTRNNYEGACDSSNRKDIDSTINLCKIQSV